jgi:hypothetical protein
MNYKYIELLDAVIKKYNGTLRFSKDKQMFYITSDLKEYISDGCHSSLNTLADTVEGCIEKLYTECERLIKEEKLAVYE